MALSGWAWTLPGDLAGRPSPRHGVIQQVTLALTLTTTKSPHNERRCETERNERTMERPSGHSVRRTTARGGGSFGRNRCAFIPHTTPLKYMAFIEPTIYSHNTQNNTDFAVTLIDSMRHSW